MGYNIVALDSKLERKYFESQSIALNNYFHKQVSQDIKRRVASCFVALTPDNKIVGFYTLSACSVVLDELVVS